MANPQAEYIEDGYVKISRRVFGSKTFSSLNAIQKLITIYLILMANYQDNKWWDNHEKKFIDIKRGSFITSVDSIKKKIKDRLVTTQKIRTLLETLKNMQFLTIKTTSRYTLITILKYNLYQDGDSYTNKPSNKAITKQQQTDNKAITTNNNGNKDNNANNGKKITNIYTHWNNQKIMVHRNIDKYKSSINSILKDYSEKEVMDTITNYKIILDDKNSLLTHRWTLKEFLTRGFDKFVDLEIAKNSYKKGDTNGKYKRINDSNTPGSNEQREPGEDKYKHLEEVY